MARITQEASVALPPGLRDGDPNGVVRPTCGALELFRLTATAAAVAAAADPVLNAPGVALNGVALGLTAAGGLPVLGGVAAECGAPIAVGPLSAVIVIVR